MIASPRRTPRFGGRDPRPAVAGVVDATAPTTRRRLFLRKCVELADYWFSPMISRASRHRKVNLAEIQYRGATARANVGRVVYGESWPLPLAAGRADSR